MSQGLLRVSVVLLALSSAVAARQAPVQDTSSTTPTALILGRAVDPDGKPVSGSEITLLAVGPPASGPGSDSGPATTRFPLRTATSADGYFLFRDLPRGSYQITGTKAGYLQSAAGRRAATDTGVQPVILGDGEKRTDVQIVFWKPATISGTVVDEAGEPIIGLEVRVLRRAVIGGRMMLSRFNVGNTVTTDDRGVYRAADLTPGTFVVGVVTTETTVPAALQGYLADAGRAGNGLDVQRELGRSTTGLGPAFLGAGQRVGSWLLAAPPPQASLTQAGVPIRGGKVFVYPTVFYPAVASLKRATPITLGSGEERGGVDFQLRPVAASQVSGTLTGLNGPEALMSLSLEPAGLSDEDREADLQTATTVTDQTGAFMFLGVPPGAYMIRGIKVPLRPQLPNASNTVIQVGNTTIVSGGGPTAEPAVPDEPTLWGETPVTVGETDVTNLAVTLSTGARLTGHIEFTGGGTPPTADQLRTMVVQVLPADRNMSGNQFSLSRGSVDAAGQFKTYQFPPGRYVIRLTALASSWFFETATLNGRDIADAPVELRGEDISGVLITMVPKGAQVSGAARDRNGRDPASAVLLFPADPVHWTDYGSSSRRLRVVRVGTNGSYSATGLPAGDYLLVAIRTDVPPDWLDAAYLEKAAALATRVTVGVGESRPQDLTAVVVR